MYGFHDLRLLLDVKHIFILALIFLFLNFVLRIFSRNPEWVKFAKQLPGPYAYPLVGNSFELMIRARNGFTPLFNRYIQTYGKTFRLWIGQMLVVVLADPKDVETVLLSSDGLRKSEMFTQACQEFFDDSLVITEPSLWKHKRRTFQPFFTKNSAHTQIPEMNKLIYKYIEEMKKLVDGPEFDVKHIMIGLTLETVLKTYSDYDLDTVQRKNLEINMVHNMTRSIEKASALMMCYWKCLKMIIALVLPADGAAAKKFSHKFIDEVLNFHRKSSKVPAQIPMKMKDEPHSSGMLAHAYLNSCIKLGEELGDEELVTKELFLIIIASIETTVATICWCIFTLAAHPEVQEKVYQEICGYFGDDERPAEKSDLDKFPYLDQVMKESARLYTIGPAISRNIPGGMKIGNYIYPEGTTALICIGGIHHDPELYPNPDQFNPDNFSPEAVSKRHKFSFIPFSAGPRNCIGKNYAEISMKLRLIALLRTFSLHTTTKPKDFKLKPGLVEDSATGYPISIRLRKKSS